MSYIVEKYVNKSPLTKFSLVYTTQIICNCDSVHRKCQNRRADGSLLCCNAVDLCAKSVMYDEADDHCVYYNSELSIDCIKQNLSLSSFSVFYSQSKPRNKTFVVSNKSDQPLGGGNNTQFFTCADFEPLTHLEPYCVNKQPSQPNMNDLIIFLNGLDRNATIKMTRELKMLHQTTADSRFILSNYFKTLDKSLFAGFLSRLEVRWSRDIKQKSEFDVEETCEGKLVWSIKFNQDYFHNQLDRLLVQLLIEMCLAFVNITLCTIKIASFNEETKMRNIFTNQADFLLEQYEYLTGMDLKSSFVRGDCSIYRYKITERSLYLMSKPLHESTLNPNSTPAVVASVNEFKFLILSPDQDLESSEDEQTLIMDKVNSLSMSDTLVATSSTDHTTDGDIIQIDTIYLQNSIEYDNIVESPYNKRDLDYNPHHYHLLHNRKSNTPTAGSSSSSTTKSTLILDYISSLREETNSSEYNVSSDETLTELRYKPGKNDSQADSKVRALRNKLYSFLLNNLDGLIQSETRLKQFRDRFICILNKHGDMSAEEFVNEAFQFFNSDLFAKLLTASTVTIEWSHRLKSSAAATVLVKNSIIIRLSVNILSKLDKIESIKMLLHEMIHSYLGVAIGDFDDKHGSNFNKILRRINHIVKLDIPIEHDYYETLDLAYIWECNKCDERRVRFYDVPPTENQKERHEEKCDGKFVLIKHPNKRT